MDNIMIVSSDGHAVAQMEDYARYLDPSFRDEFAAFCAVFRERGSHSSDAPSMHERTDPDIVEEWVRDVLDAGRIEGRWDPARRVAELDAEGIAAEVLIPDFGTPFELYTPTLAAHLGYPARDDAHIDAANRAHNRWLVDFCSADSERFAGMAAISFADVDRAVAEIHWAHSAGLRGVMLPSFADELPLFLPEFDPIWTALEDLEMVLNAHPGISSTTNRVWTTPVPHPACAGPIWRGITEFYNHQVLDHLIWGCVLDRHPRLNVVFTEQGSAWIPGKLEAMDYSYSGSYMRQDIREAVRELPSTYFERQCYIGSSLLSRAEVANRQAIGIHKMMVGADYPHHEGTWHLGNVNYLQATFGAVGVPEAECRQMLGETAARVFGFDVDKLTPIVERVGPSPATIMTAPTEEKFPRGDVNKPLSGLFSL